MMTASSPAPQPLASSEEHRTGEPNATFRWEPVPNATGYHVQVAATPDFDRPLLDVSTDATTSFTLDETLPRGASTLYWRVRAQRPSGLSSWSAPQPFTTPTAQQEMNTSDKASSTASQPSEGESIAPVRRAQTSLGGALFWILFTLISFAATLALLIWAAIQIP